MAVWLLWGLLAGVAVFAGYVRLAPSDPGHWHVAPVAEGPAGATCQWPESEGARRT